MRRSIERLEERANGLDKPDDRFEQMVMGDLATKVLPEEFNGIEPGRIGRQREENELVGIVFQELHGLLAVMNNEVIYDQNDLLSVIVW